MPPRPLYKWKSFWLGLLVLGFLGWVWMRSTRRLDFLDVRLPPDKVYNIGSYGGVFIAVESDVPGVADIAFALRSHRSPDPAARRWALYSRSTTDYRVLVAFPLWLPILLILLPWSAYLIWRWRRLKRVEENSNIEHRTSNAQHRRLKE